MKRRAPIYSSESFTFNLYLCRIVTIWFRMWRWMKFNEWMNEWADKGFWTLYFFIIDFLEHFQLFFFCKTWWREYWNRKIRRFIFGGWFEVDKVLACHTLWFVEIYRKMCDSKVTKLSAANLKFAAGICFFFRCDGIKVFTFNRPN